MQNTIRKEFVMNRILFPEAIDRKQAIEA